jgi:hypothetical protein
MRLLGSGFPWPSVSSGRLVPSPFDVRGVDRKAAGITGQQRSYIRLTVATFSSDIAYSRSPAVRSARPRSM